MSDQNNTANIHPEASRFAARIKSGDQEALDRVLTLVRIAEIIVTTFRNETAHLSLAEKSLVFSHVERKCKE